MADDDPIRVLSGLSAAQMRAIAHPLRLRMLEVLREGPATASALGRRLGESSGATSYHLRGLAAAGLVEEEERGSKRERWWRRLDSFTVIPRAIPPGATAEEEDEIRAAIARIDAYFLDRDDAALREWIGEIHAGEWQDASMLGNWTIVATPDEVKALWALILREVDALRRAPDAAPEGAAPVHVSLRLLPTPARRDEAEPAAPPRTS
jgi:DNA-binding transcriptional ArsR family regulator